VGSPLLQRLARYRLKRRSRAPDEKGNAPSAQNGASPEGSKSDEDPICGPPLTQAGGLAPAASLPMDKRQINKFSWALYEDMLTDPDGQKCVKELLKYAAVPDVMLGAAFLAGANCALMAIQSPRQPSVGNN
jgi:hypothetical protein